MFLSLNHICPNNNGGALKPFLPSRGIRHGDPLSPYLFILYMEVLGALIIEKCDAKLWDPIKASRGGLAFSHLFFANDLPFWQSVTKPQQTNEHMKEVINHSAHNHLLNTIKSILTQTLEKLCRKRV